MHATFEVHSCQSLLWLHCVVKLQHNSQMTSNASLHILRASMIDVHRHAWSLQAATETWTSLLSCWLALHHHCGRLQLMLLQTASHCSPWTASLPRWPKSLRLRLEPPRQACNASVHPSSCMHHISQIAGLWSEEPANTAMICTLQDECCCTSGTPCCILATPDKPAITVCMIIICMGPCK